MRKAPTKSSSKKGESLSRKRDSRKVELKCVTLPSEARTVESVKQGDKRSDQSSMLITEMDSFFKGDNTAKFNSLRVP